MRQALRLFTIISFAVFLITAALAFSVRPASAAPTAPDAGTDAGATDLASVLGGSGDRAYLAGSKSFGASVAPEGFGGLGLRGGGGAGIGGPGFRTPQVVDLVVRGPLPRAAARQLATAAVSVKSAEAPCVVRPGVFVLELVVSPEGLVKTARELPVDGGFVGGAVCVAERAKRSAVSKASGPSTVLVTYEVARPQP